MNFWHIRICLISFISINERSCPVTHRLLKNHQFCALPVNQSEGGKSGNWRKRRQRPFYYQTPSLSEAKNMQHFPFIRTNSALCVGTVHHSAVWMEVSMLLIVALLLLEADGRAMIEILLTEQQSSVCLWHVKFFQNTLFSRRRSQQAAATVTRTFFVFGWEAFHICVNDGEQRCVCSWIHVCFTGELCMILWMKTDPHVFYL